MGKITKESLLKQIEEYNDFIIQNDLDAELINPDHDYDFSAFKPTSWQAESDRLADRLSDRKVEIAQNEDAGEFAGMELENGVPSYESVKNMSDEQFKAYEQKYLTPSADIPEPQQVGSDDIVDTNATVTAPIVVPAIDTNRTDDLNVTDNNLSEKVDFSDDVAELADANSTKAKEPEYEFSLPMAWELFKGSHPGVKNTVDAVDSVGKVIDQGQPINALQDTGRGIMSGLADTAGSIADIGGLLPNRVADMAHESGDWWRDQYEIVDSEAGNIGNKVGSEAVAGVAGGAVGKGIGKVYKGMRHGGEALRKRATLTASGAEKRAKLYGQGPLESAITRQKAYENMTNVPPRHSYTKALFGDAQPVAGSVRIDPIPYGHTMSKENLLTKVLREQNHLNGKALDGGYSAYDVLNPVAGKMEYPTSSRLMDAMIHNSRRKLDSRTMLKSNDEEIATMFNRGVPLDTAIKASNDRWNRLPIQGAQTGTALGLAVGQ